jgi:Cd2+/Zn2+-exporting ATPase
MATLQQLKGVESILINTVGRNAVIKHCPVPCCASPEMLVDLLNEKYLGASIQELNDGDDDTDEEITYLENFHVLMVLLLFLVGLAIELSHTEGTEVVAMWIFIVSVLIGIWPILIAAIIALVVRKTLDIHVLMIIAIAGAVAAGDYFDGSLVVALFLSAERLEGLLMWKLRKAVKQSSSGAIPKNATLTDGSKVPTDRIKVGMVICVRAGEMILADGVVLKGEAVVDEAALSGECVPIHKGVGEEVRSGTIVHNGYVEVRATKEAGESTLQRLRQEVNDVQADRGQYARIVDTFAMYWTPLVLLTTILYVVIRGANSGEWEEMGRRGLLILVLACPCAIVISAPVPAICAIANAAQHGVLIRGSSVVERLAVVDAVGLDKTGTLTKGFFKVVTRLALTDDADEAESAMAFAAAIEEKSTHPLADAVVSAHLGCVAEAGDNALPAVRKVKVLDGVGVSGWVEDDGDWKYVVVGNERLLKKNGGSVRVSAAQERQIAAFVAAAANSAVLFVTVEDELLLLLALSDELRPDSKLFVQTLTSLGMQIAMLTGTFYSQCFCINNCASQL